LSCLTLSPAALSQLCLLLFYQAKTAKAPSRTAKTDPVNEPAPLAIRFDGMVGRVTLPPLVGTVTLDGFGTYCGVPVVVDILEVLIAEPVALS